MRRTFALGLTLALAVTILGGCQSPGASGDHVDGVLAGKVTDAQGHPIEDAVIQLRRVDGLPMDAMGLASLADGTFERDLEQAAYHLAVHAEGYREYREDIQIKAGFRLYLDIQLQKG
jgi:hypothetical protein